jgi:hypothetical protein
MCYKAYKGGEGRRPNYTLLIHATISKGGFAKGVQRREMVQIASSHHQILALLGSA